MHQERSSDFTPFKYEPQRRADRAFPASKEQDLAKQQLEAMRLLRSAPNPRDRTLSKVAEEWRDRVALRLPTQAVCERYPRIANRIALCWSDRVLTERLLDDLLRDRRGGRNGFPEPVHAELVALAAELRKNKATR
jgi:hypothetical protein